MWAPANRAKLALEPAPQRKTPFQDRHEQSRREGHVAPPTNAPQRYPAYDRGDGSYGDRSYGDRSYGDRSYGDRSYGDRSYGDRSYGDRSYGDRSYGDRSYGDRSYGYNDRSYDPRDRSYGGGGRYNDRRDTYGRYQDHEQGPPAAPYERQKTYDQDFPSFPTSRPAQSQSSAERKEQRRREKEALWNSIWGDDSSSEDERPDKKAQAEEDRPATPTGPVQVSTPRRKSPVNLPRLTSASKNQDPNGSGINWADESNSEGDVGDELESVLEKWGKTPTQASKSERQSSRQGERTIMSKL